MPGLIRDNLCLNERHYGFGDGRRVESTCIRWDEADRMFALLVKRAAELADRRPSPGTPEDEEFDRLVSAIEAYEAKRWPDGSPRRRRPGSA